MPHRVVCLDFEPSASRVFLQLTLRHRERLPEGPRRILSGSLDFGSLSMRQVAIAFDSRAWLVAHHDLVARNDQVDAHPKVITLLVVTVRNLDEHFARLKVGAVRAEPGDALLNVSIQPLTGWSIAIRDISDECHDDLG
jgi:hypothetical protein